MSCNYDYIDDAYCDIDVDETDVFLEDYSEEELENLTTSQINRLKREAYEHWREQNISHYDRYMVSNRDFM